MRPRLLPVLIAMALAGLWGAGLGLMHLRGGVWFLDRVEATMVDLRLMMRGPKPAPDLVTIVAIDDKVASQEGYPLPRATLGRLIGEIAGMQPKAIAVDLLLVDPGPADGDALLAQALRAAPAVIAAAAVFPEDRQFVPGSGLLEGIPVAASLLLPQPLFSDASAVGVVNVSTDQTGTPRFVPMLFRSGERFEASLPLRAASIAAGVEPIIEPGRISVGDKTIRTDIGEALPLAFYGSRGTVRTVSAADVLDGRIDVGLVAGRVVVIGGTVTGGGDVFPTPFDPVLPGVEVVSTAVLHLMTGDGLVRDRTTRLVDAGMAFALPVIVVGLLAWRRNAAGLILAAAVLILALAVNMMAFRQGIWLSAAVPVTAAGVPALLFGGMQIWLGRRSAQHFATQSALLQRIQAPGLGQWLARNPDFLVEPVRQDAAVVFVDLSGFTGLSETLGPGATRELLDVFYDMVADETAASGGAVTSFMGDGAMILFGLPQPEPADAANAARCCVALSRRVGKWIGTLPGPVASRLGFKIGAHFGVVVASRLGRGDSQQITVTGDTVNVASRLMEVAASRRMPVAVSDALVEASGREPFSEGRLDGPMQAALRGRAETISAWTWREAGIG